MPTLREVLATNTALRRNVQKAATAAAYQVLTDAGITITDADIADAKGDVAAMSLPVTTGAKDPAGDVAVGILIGIATGF